MDSGSWGVGKSLGQDLALKTLYLRPKEGLFRENRKNINPLAAVQALLIMFLI